LYGFSQGLEGEKKMNSLR